MGEALTIRTGKMGHGKTLNAIREIDAQAFKENRLVYYHNIDGLKPDTLKASWFEFNDPFKWFELPHNSIIVIDEAQRFFPVRDPRAGVPDYISQLETIRHQGQEIVFITQDHRLLDVNIRRLCGCHIHFSRVFGSNFLYRYQFSEASDFDKPTVRKTGDRTKIKLDKKIFNSYKSSSGEHHFKLAIPKKIYLFILLIIISCFLLGKTFINYFKSSEPEKTPAVASEALKNKSKDKTLLGSMVDTVKATTGLSDDTKKPMTVKEYLDYYKPRIEGVPQSAPAYDKLTEPKTYPRLSCFMTTSANYIIQNKQKTAYQRYDGQLTACSCYTQQGTIYKVAFKQCVNIVENGYFDPAKPDYTARRSRSKTREGVKKLQQRLAIDD